MRSSFSPASTAVATTARTSGRFELQPTKDSPTGVVLYFASRDGLKSDDSDMHNYLAPEGYTGYRGGDAKDNAPNPTGARIVALR